MSGDASIGSGVPVPDLLVKNDLNHASLLLRRCAGILSSGELVDCTVVCKDGNIMAHKVRFQNHRKRNILYELRI